MSYLLEDLNKEQVEAVKHTEGPLLVLAGAGAGKTRVITYRIAYLIQEKNVHPWNILAVTFTNKAAGEMKHRISKLIGNDARKIWMGTFHSIGLNILRKFGEQSVIGIGFGVIDQDDRLRVVRNIVKELGIDHKKHSPKGYLSAISDYKNTAAYVEMREVEDIVHRFKDVFTAYENSIRQQKLVDYDDMLSVSLRLILQNEDILSYYKTLCKYILVDEYQDTNIIQFAFLKALAGDSGNICVVGDDDQAIYGWRGAQVENILYFDDHFQHVKEVKLVNNYRSAPEILTRANELIRNNVGRRGKDLIACSERQGVVKYKRFMDESIEAEYISKAIQEMLESGVPASEIAVLYRTNAQSRNFEVVLNRFKIKYKVVGGVGFYQRREVKDILSYLRVYDNPYDEVSFTRITRTPPKGIGAVLLETVTSYALENNLDCLSACELLIPVVTPRQATSLSIVRNIMHKLVTCETIAEKVDLIIEESGYKEYLIQTEDEQEAKVRTENLYELYNAALIYDEQITDGSLTDFLATTTLITSGDNEDTESVSLMTLHAAKGLEFESVFITGLEEGIFPLASQDECDDLEEERRLCYVGITRAKVNLHMTNATSRMIHGKRQLMKPSRFVMESGFMTPVVADRQKSNPAFEDGVLRKGQMVNHELFGDGVVLQISGNGDNAKVDVMFKKHGIKKLVSRFLKVH